MFKTTLSLDRARAHSLSTALSQFIENANDDPEEQGEEERMMLFLSQKMLDEVDAFIASLADVSPTDRCQCGDKVGHIEACEFRKS